MSYQYEFLHSRKIEGKWGYRVYVGVNGNTCPRGRTDLFMSGGILTVNTLVFFAGSTETDVFIEQSEDGLTVPLSFEDLELTTFGAPKAAIISDRVNFYDTGNASLSSASFQIDKLPFSTVATIEPTRWNISTRRKISLVTPDVPLNCTASFISKLDLNPVLPLRGTFTISELIDRGALVEYLTFPTVTASTATVDG